MGVTFQLPGTSPLPATGSASPGRTPLLIEEWTEPFHFQSSNVSSARYNPTDSVLEVTFRDGHVYHYLSVPSDVFEGMVTAPSAGRYLHAKVKKRYPASRVA